MFDNLDPDAAVRTGCAVKTLSYGIAEAVRIGVTTPLLRGLETGITYAIGKTANKWTQITNEEYFRAVLFVCQCEEAELVSKVQEEVVIFEPYDPNSLGFLRLRRFLEFILSYLK